MAALTRQIRDLLQVPSDGPTFQSLFKDHNTFVCRTTRLAEIGNCRAREPTQYRARQRLTAQTG